MSGPDGTKRQRTDGYPPGAGPGPLARSPATPEPSTEPRKAPSAAPAPAPAETLAEPSPEPTLLESAGDRALRVLLERLLASQERLSADVAQLHQTVSAAVSMLHHTPPPPPPPPHSDYYHHPHPQYPHQEPQQRMQRPAPAVPSRPQSAMAQPHSPSRTLGGVPPTLANIVSLQTLPADQLSPGSAGARDVKFDYHSRMSPLPSASSAAPGSPKLPFPYGMDPARAASASDAGSAVADGGSGGAPQQPAHRHHAYEFHSADTSGPASPYYTTTPFRPVVANRQPQPQPQQVIAVPRLYPPPSSAFSSHNRSHQYQRQPQPQHQHNHHHQHNHQHHHNHPHTQQQHQHQHVSIQKPSTPLSAALSAAPIIPAAHRGDYQFGKQQHSVSLPRFPPHQTHGQYSLTAAAVAAASPASPRRVLAPAHSEQSLALPPIMRVPAVARPHDSCEQYSPVSAARKASMPQYSAPSLAAGMAVDATTPAKPSYPAGGSPPAIAMVESPTGSSGPRNHQQHHYVATPGGGVAGGGGGGSSGGGRSYNSAMASAMQKVEKNRFQANIRAFVDQHFMTAANLHWDYQQSFKAPHNAEATHQMAEAFRVVHSGVYDRIEHGLGVYFSSLKAKYRTTEDKAMLKQQRDRRRARRIKKAAGRRKVFDKSQYPFLPKEMNTLTCFVPLAMSPEHTDDDGEVKVGALPWRLSVFSKLFHHLDTLRPKRTPRHAHPSLRDTSAPMPEIPSCMIDQAYMAMSRVHRGHAHGHDVDPDDDDDDDVNDEDDDDDADDYNGNGNSNFDDDDDEAGHHADLEDDVEMDSSSDGGPAPSASAMSL